MNLFCFRPKLLAAIVALTVSTAFAQTTPAPAGNAARPSGEVIRLNEFTVSADPDRGYVASETLTGSRVRTPIIDLPYTVNVLTSEFFEDFAIFELADNLVHNLIGGVTVPRSTLFPLTLPVGGAARVTRLLERLVDSEVPATTVLALTVFMNNRLATLPAIPTLTQVLPHLRDLTSLVLRLPEAHLN